MKRIAWGNVTPAEAGSRFSHALPPGSPGGTQPNSMASAKQGDAGAMEKAEDLAACLKVLDGGLDGALRPASCAGETDAGLRRGKRRPPLHSHSMVPGGLLVMS